MDSLLERAYNPDVLSCLANLSNDEVFTPPELANQVLNMLPPELWESPDTKILDPCCSPGGRVGGEQPRLRALKLRHVTAAKTKAQTMER